MEYEQKGILIVIDDSHWKQLEREFTVTQELVNNLAVADIDYIYLAKRANHGYFSGYLGHVRKVTIETGSAPQNRVYSFELSEYVRPASLTGDLKRVVDGKKNGDVFDWGFEQILKAAHVSDDPDTKPLENPANTDIRPLSINEAIKRLSGTYGVNSEKISISITG